MNRISKSVLKGAQQALNYAKEQKQGVKISLVKVAKQQSPPAKQKTSIPVYDNQLTKVGKDLVLNYTGNQGIGGIDMHNIQLAPSEVAYLQQAQVGVEAILAKHHAQPEDTRLDLEQDESDEWISFEVHVNKPAPELFAMNKELVEWLAHRTNTSQGRDVVVMFM